MKLNNKGFAITTILYGMLILFLMLFLSMLGMLSSYKDRLGMLIDSNNGARDIINGNNAKYTVYVDHYYYDPSTNSWAHFKDVDQQVNANSMFTPYSVSDLDGYSAKQFKYYYKYSNGTYSYIGLGNIGSDSFKVTQDMIVNMYYCSDTETCPSII